MHEFTVNILFINLMYLLFFYSKVHEAILIIIIVPSKKKRFLHTLQPRFFFPDAKIYCIDESG